MTKKVAVLGLGRFGSKLARELFFKGIEVIAVDHDQEALEKIRDQVTNIYQVDNVEKHTLLSIGVKDCDTVIIAHTESIEWNIIATQTCIELEIPKIICLAKNTIHGMILSKLGVHQIIYPEQEMAIKVANKLSSKGILDYFELGAGLSIVGTKPPDNWIGKSLQQLDLRAKHNITVAALHRDGESILIPAWTTVIEKNDILVVIGSEESLKELNFDTTHRT